MNTSKLLVVVLVGVISVFSGVDSGKKDKDGCLMCDEELCSTVKMLSAVVKGMEPMQQHNVSICSLVEIRGIQTIKHNNKSCLKEDGKGKEGKCYYQMFEVIIGKVEVGCKLNGSPAEVSQIVLKEAASAGMGAVKGVGDKIKGALGGIGKRAAPPAAHGKSEFFINGSWANPRIKVEMRACFDDDVYNITDVAVIDNTFTGLKLWCEGGSLIDKVCHVFTGADFVRSLNGFFIKIFAARALADALEDPTLGGQLTALNCGVQYDD